MAIVAETLRAQHFDGTGCGTDGPNACSNCYGSSAMSSTEVAATAVDTVLSALLRKRSR